MAWSKLTSMELDDEDKIDLALPAPISTQPDYPWGLRITLTEKELTKLGLEADCDLGDIIDLRALARVTSVSASDGPSGKCCRVELQIEQLATENESTEDMA